MAYLIGKGNVPRAQRNPLYFGFILTQFRIVISTIFLRKQLKRTEKWVLSKAQEVMRRAEEASQQCSFVKHAKS